VMTLGMFQDIGSLRQRLELRDATECSPSIPAVVLLWWPQRYVSAGRHRWSRSKWTSSRLSERKTTRGSMPHPCPRHRLGRETATSRYEEHVAKIYTTGMQRR